MTHSKKPKENDMCKLSEIMKCVPRPYPRYLLWFIIIYDSSFTSQLQFLENSCHRNRIRLFYRAGIWWMQVTVENFAIRLSFSRIGYQKFDNLPFTTWISRHNAIRCSCSTAFRELATTFRVDPLRIFPVTNGLWLGMIIVLLLKM